MSGARMMLGHMLMRRTVAAENDPTAETFAQVHPGLSGFAAIFAHVRAVCRGGQFHALEVFTQNGHGGRDEGLMVGVVKPWLGLQEGSKSFLYPYRLIFCHDETKPGAPGREAGARYTP